MEYKFKVGDTVRVRKELKNTYYNGVYVTENMLHLCGSKMKVSNRHDLCGSAVYQLDGDGGHYSWTEGMLESADKFEIGDKVVVSEHLVAGKTYNDGCHFTSGMLKYRGKEGVVERVTHAGIHQKPRYQISLAGESWYFSDDMLELAPSRYKPTDTIVITTDGNETRAYHKKGGKVISQSKCVRSKADEHDLTYAAKLVLDRLSEQEVKKETFYTGKIFVIVLDSYGTPVQMKTAHTYDVIDGVIFGFENDDVMRFKRFHSVEEIQEFFEDSVSVYEVEGEVKA